MTTLPYKSLKRKLTSFKAQKSVNIFPMPYSSGYKKISRICWKSLTQQQTTSLVNDFDDSLKCTGSAVAGMSWTGLQALSYKRLRKMEFWAFESPHFFAFHRLTEMKYGVKYMKFNAAYSRKWLLIFSVKYLHCYQRCRFGLERSTECCLTSSLNLSHCALILDGRAATTDRVGSGQPD